MPPHSENVTFQDHFILNFLVVFAVISLTISKVGTGTAHASVHRALQEQQYYPERICVVR